MIATLSAPRARTLIGVERLLQWAFQAERAAVFEPDEHAQQGRSTIATIIERGDLGCTIDYFGARWRRHDDADVVADAVETLDPPLALMVAENARAGTRPIGLACAPQRWRPALGWAERSGRPVAKTAVWRLVETRARTRSGWRRTLREERYTPVALHPDGLQIIASRLAYAQWWGALAQIRCYEPLLHLRDWALVDSMPPAEPWVASQGTH